MTKLAKGKTSTLVIALGYDEHQKPRGAKFEGANVDLVTKAAGLMGLNVYEAKSDEVAELARKLPIGRLYANGNGFVPVIRPKLYSQLLVALAVEPGAAVGEAGTAPSVASGLPKTWDEITSGHLVIAQESLENGWWESVVVETTGDILTLRFRDHPQLPKFYRHRAAVALIREAP
jgi:hypothetical protein